MKEIEIRGKAKDVCAYLKAEAQRCKGMTVEQYIRLRTIEKAEREQFGEEVHK